MQYMILSLFTIMEGDSMEQTPREIIHECYGMMKHNGKAVNRPYEIKITT